ncbi:FdhF/YdeP family oxidoreductase [Coralloluteibacterium thermophilus]|uniref:FdhF/YdeP family oxidoreductase n=1 Tax=Coralloluteibacterium thermophilum TaxID=2707049 RepID=A0ABV9NJR6_9GAMM
MARRISFTPYEGPAGGWGSVRSLARHTTAQRVPLAAPPLLIHQNKPHGFACVSCAWSKPAEPHPFEFCENGAKATLWEITDKRATPALFARHTLAEFRTWPDHDLEDQGRLTHPMRWDPASDKYVPVEWSEAFAEIGRELRAIREEDPESAVFYASGRASLETSYMYQLLARLYGNNNLPDSSNMCHESTSVALPKSIGVPVGTTVLDDFEKTGCLLFFGQNPGVNSPRMLHPLQECSKRGVPIITFNPLRERGLERFLNPQSPPEMLSGKDTPISSQYHQLKPGGDIAAIAGMCKALFALDDEAKAAGRPRVLDVDFLEQHTHGLGEFEAWVRATSWSDIERDSGLSREALEGAARVYASAESAIGIYGMGLTQHKDGVTNARMLINLLLLRGNIGKPGAGILPVRGHSNVQGQRTVGIAEKPELVPLDKLAELYGFDPPRKEGLATIPACEAILEGKIRAFVSLGGNFLRAVPEHARMERAWTRMRLSVQVATKLNRSHLIPAEVTYLLPCLGRLERDVQNGVEQSVSMEDTSACIHGSKGRHEPASPHLLSEPRIVAEIAKAALPHNPKVPWDAWVADYAKIRDAIERTWPDQFADFNARMWTPGGFPRPLPARHRVWKTETGKANFVTPEKMDSFAEVAAPGDDVLRLMTVRSNDQFNTTIYGYRDRFRGIQGTRRVVMMNARDLERFGLADGDVVTLEGAARDGEVRRVENMRVVEYDVPQGACAAYYPECNPLIPLWHHADESQVPAAKSVPVRVRASAQPWSP